MATFEDRLARETRAWVEDGLVSADQATAIRARYAREGAALRRGRLVSVLSILGSVAVGAGVILFFASNWDAFPKLVRLVVLLVALAATLVGGDRLRASYPRVGEAVRFLGGLLFGASIFLVGQMYDVSDDIGLGFLLWAAGAAAGTAVFRSPLWATLAIGTFAAWLGYEIGDASDSGAIPYVLGLYGLGIYALATRLRAREQLGLVRGVGLLVGWIPIYALTFRGLSDDASHAHLAHRVVLIGALVAVGALAAAALLALDRRRPTARWEALGVGASLVVLLLGTQVSLTAVTYNVLVVVLALGAIAVGFESDEPWLVNLGIGLAAVELVTRFFDVLWHFLPRSLAFLATGCFLLVLAWILERQRSKLIAKMSA